jgi:hypothetical protein
LATLPVWAAGWAVLKITRRAAKVARAALLEGPLLELLALPAAAGTGRGSPASAGERGIARVLGGFAMPTQSRCDSAGDDRRQGGVVELALGFAARLDQLGADASAQLGFNGCLRAWSGSVRPGRLGHASRFW